VFGDFLFLRIFEILAGYLAAKAFLLTLTADLVLGLIERNRAVLEN